MKADLRLERRIARTPEACFDLWTRPDEVARWWGPRDDAGRPFKAKVEAWSAVPGKPWAITMIAPDGTRYPQSGKMLEVTRPHLLRFTFGWVTDGQRGPETEIRVTFMPKGSGTLMIFEQIGFVDTATRDGHIKGWEECLDRLVTHGADGMASDA
jgi:uncharacterized protein YndB with AHSA1/START domain